MSRRKGDKDETYVEVLQIHRDAIEHRTSREHQTGTMVDRM